MSKALFRAPSSAFDPSFWEELYNIKLNVHRLESSDLAISASLNLSGGGRGQPLSFSKDSFGALQSHGQRAGTLRNVNTVEEFRDLDKKTLLQRTSLAVLESIFSLAAVHDPAKLFTFVLLTYADLKGYRFTYWCGIPAIIPDQPFTSDPPGMLRDATYEGGFNICLYLYKALGAWLAQPASENPLDKQLQSVFALRFIDLSAEESLSESTSAAGGGEGTEDDGILLVQSHAPAEYQMHLVDSQRAEILTLSQAWPLRHSRSVYFVVMDGAGATSAEDASAGGMSWVVRNFLTMVAVHKPSYEHSSDSSVRVIGFSGTLATMMNSQRIPDVENLLSVSANSDQSILCEYNIPDGLYPRLFLPAQVAEASLEAQGLMEHMNVVGWETNERGKPGPRVADLTQTLDSAYIMSQAVDLNLRLMKWRLWPALDTDRLASNCKCLLLGAGTLGCAVARALLGWGVRDITFVDSGIVSYSNPARQCLFEYQDCVNRSYKAVAAAARLQKIFPGVRSRGVVMSIPMPGHPLHAASSSSPSDEEANYLQFVELVNSHDVIFTLTDSRESRWLPTLLCAANDKLLINAALGFDSYLVMRHGGSSGMVVNAGMKASTTLGCYFCNDVVAATNSQRDRSLDQQCTVTRPGLSFIAAALAVEMMVALFNPQAREVGEGEGEGEGDDTPDGDHAGLEVPHQIRGSLAGFTQMTPYSPAFSNCTACSKQVVDAFQHGVGQIEPGFNFIQHVCADSSVLESVSGIAELMDTIDLDQCVESDEDF